MPQVIAEEMEDLFGIFGAEGEDEEDPNQLDPFISAVRDDNVEEIKKLYGEESRDLNADVGDGYTPLQEAARWGKKGSIKALVELGADAKLVDSLGHTLVSRAVVDGIDDTTTAETIELLASPDIGADVKQADKTGATPYTQLPRRVLIRLSSS